MTALVRFNHLVLMAVVWSAAVGAADLPRINKQGYTSASVCAQCHEDIYRYWEKSLHAQAFTNPIFQTALAQAVLAEGEAARQFCLPCHAPTVRTTRDFAARSDLTREGIGCDFCHTVTGVNPAHQVPEITTAPGEVKRSVLQGVTSPAHRVEYSKLHGESLFCAGCHELQGKNGVLILGTYSEWKTGPYAAEGTQCQTCHMPAGDGNVVKPGIKSSDARINLHNISGAHSEDMLARAAALEIRTVRAEAGRITVEVAVSNVGAGHYLPTGSPSRRCRLVVKLRLGNRVLAEQERVYSRTLLDAAGKPLKYDYEIMLHTAQLGGDTRLRPKETRLETFTFPISPREGIAVSAEFSYQYTPVLIQEAPMVVPIHRSESKVGPVR